MTSYELLLRLERMGAHTVEIKERTLLTGAEALTKTLAQGVANTTDNGMIACYIGNDDGSEDCTLTIDGFNKRFYITNGIFGEWNQAVK